jgi:predicted membrane protein
MRALRWWLGGVLVALGVIWLLDVVGLLNAGLLIGRWWPLALIVLGLLAVLSERHLSAGPVILVLVGAALLISDLTVVNLGGILWASLFIVVGIWMLADFALRRNSREYDDDIQDVFALLGASHVKNRSSGFRHADVLAVLGGATLDLQDADLAPAARVYAMAILGGVDVIVPTNVRVEMSGLPIFGGYQDKSVGPRELPADAPTLKVVAIALFGGVEIKNPQSSAALSPITQR